MGEGSQPLPAAGKSAEGVHAAVQADSRAHDMGGYFGGQVEGQVGYLVGTAVAFVQVLGAKDLLRLLMGFRIAEGILFNAANHRI